MNETGDKIIISKKNSTSFIYQLDTSTNKWNYVQNISIPGNQKVHLAC